MHAQLARTDLGDEHRLQLHFALGKALRGRGRPRARVRALRAGQCAASCQPSLRRGAEYPTGRGGSSRPSRVSSSRPAPGQGCDAPDPIFIVGMPRAGSTLLEQILSSHSAVEGTMELPEIITLAKELRAEAEAQEIAAYVDVLAGQVAAELRELGEKFLERTRIHRKTGPPVLHRQDAEQLPARRHDPADPAAGEDHRRAPPPARLLLLELQAALRARPELQLQPRPTWVASIATTSS